MKLNIEMSDKITGAMFDVPDTFPVGISDLNVFPYTCDGHCVE